MVMSVRLRPVAPYKYMIFRNFNPKERDFEILKLIQFGFTITSIAKMIGVSRQRVSAIKKKMIHLEQQNWNNIPTRLNNNIK